MQTLSNRWIGSAAVRAAALGVALLGAGGARGQSAPWGWDTGGPAFRKHSGDVAPLHPVATTANMSHRGLAAHRAPQAPP